MKERIGDICTLKSGTTLKEDLLIEDGTIPYVKVSDMNLIGNEKYIVTANSYAVSNISEKMLFPIGTVLFPKRGGAIGTNKKRIASRTVCADLNTMGVIPSERIRPLFLYYYFRNIDFGDLYNGSSVPQINNTDIAPMEIELPPLEEQDIAVAQLEKVDCIIQRRVEELTKLDELIKARFVELFGDIVLNPIGHQETTVAEYCQMTQGTQIPMSEQISEYKEGYYRYLYIRDLKYEDDNWIYVLDQYDEKKLTEDDLVVVNTGNTAGEIYRGKDGILSNNLFKVSFDTEILSTTYLYYYFGSDAFQKMLWSEMKEGTQPHLGHKIFGSKKLLVPPMAIQEQFSNFVKQVDKSKIAVQRSLEKTQLLFDNLMQEHFG